MKLRTRLRLAMLFLALMAAAYLLVARSRRPPDPLPDLMAALETETRAYVQADWSRRDPPGELANGQAWDHYREAIRLCDELAEGLQGEVDFPSSVTDPARDCWGDVLAVPEEYRHLASRFTPAIEAVMTGSRCAVAGPVQEFGPESGEEPPGAAVFISAISGRMICNAVLLLQAGREAEALDQFLALHRAGADCFRGGHWVALGGGLGMQRRIVDVLSAAIAAGRISPQGVARIETALLSRPPEPLAALRCMQACWLGEQWHYARVGAGLEELMDGAGKYRSPEGEMLPVPAGREEVLAGWAWVRAFEEEMAATRPANSTADLRAIGAELKVRARKAAPALAYFATDHAGAYDRVPDLLDLRQSLKHQLAANIALARRRAKGHPDPEAPTELLPEGASPTTPFGPFIWWLEPGAKDNWIGIETPGKRRSREEE